MAEKRKFTLPSIDQVEQLRQKKKPTNFFQAASSGSPIKTTATPTPATSLSTTTPAAQTSSSTDTHAETASPISHSSNKSILRSSTISQTSTSSTSNNTRLITTSQSSTSSNIRPVTTSISSTNNTQLAPAQPTRRTAAGYGNTILVNYSRQKDNPILKLIHNVPWEHDDVIKCDFAVGKTTGVWFLSLRYHRLNPGYIHDRIGDAARTYVLRILLVHVDIDNFHEPLRELNRTAIQNNFTLVLAWTKEETARYLETFKVLEHTPPDMIREKAKEDYAETLERCLTNIRSVNKTDVLTLRSHFHSLKGIANARADQLAMCPGFGEQKVKRLQQAFVQPFIVKQKKK
ncbi:hypothetical protein INT45_006897 [Circinella minor]|uniref:DNA excision repair protein ERCC-1 n=1 Tax=Circinella minor TaxID=1195481 RepID=A0A8H7S555_9FUNG|nr:hypothetical protein INT45_006897 [Circinella minor]